MVKAQIAEYKMSTQKEAVWVKEPKRSTIKYSKLGLRDETKNGRNSITNVVKSLLRIK